MTNVDAGDFEVVGEGPGYPVTTATITGFTAVASGTHYRATVSGGILSTK